MKYNLYLTLSLSFFISSCSSRPAINKTIDGVNAANVVGRDVDVVIEELQKKGLLCREYESRELFTNRLVGGVKCVQIEHSGFCPRTFSLTFFYEINSNKINSLGKNVRDNCF